MLHLPDNATLLAFSGLVLLRPATPEEVSTFLQREHQPRAFALMDRGWDADKAAAFIDDTCVGDIYFFVEYKTEGLHPDSWSRTLTGFTLD